MATQIGHLGIDGGTGIPILLLDPVATFTVLNQAAINTGRGLPDPRTLWKRMKERLEPLGLMVCEADKTTYRRAVFGSTSRVALVNLKARFAEFTGTTGTESARKTVEKNSSFVPIIF